MDTYTVLKFIHVIAAIVAVGTTTTYFVWYALLRDPSAVDVLRGVKMLDDRVANPAYAVVLLAGLGMSFVADLWSVVWIQVALGLFALVLVLAVAVFTPSLKAQIRLADRGVDDADFQAAFKRGRVAGSVLMLLVLAILVLMVFQPMLG